MVGGEGISHWGPFLNTTDTTARQAPNGLKHSAGTNPTWLHKNQHLGKPFQGSRLRTLKLGYGRGSTSPTFTNEKGREMGVKFAASITSPFQPIDSPSTRLGGLQRGGGLWDTPHEKDVPPTHREMATRGCLAPYREGSPSARSPTTTQREVTGAYPIPQLPKPQAEENPGTGNGGPGENQFFVFLQS